MSRQISPGMGQAVAERTILRRKEDGTLETWEDVAHRVALGNTMLHPSGAADYEALRYHIAQGNTVMSGRHLQHGDEAQPFRNMEVFTNCSTSCTSFAQFYLMLNGSGVGRCYDDDLMLVDWDKAPTVRCVLDASHPDYDWEVHESKRDAQHKFGTGSNVIWHEVGDSREGWAKALEAWEVCAYQKCYADHVLVLDFSKVRARGQPIKGMQNRPASGPITLMAAFDKASSIKGAGLPRWKQAMYVDHYFAECVLVGGARRAARMATKTWKDPGVFEFAGVKRPIEYHGKTRGEIKKMPKALGFLWTSNNSVTVDEEFWRGVNYRGREVGSDRLSHTDIAWNEVEPNHIQAKGVFDNIVAYAYADGTGEPGFINVDKLVQKDRGMATLNGGDYFGSEKYQPHEDAQLYLARLLRAARKKKHHTIVNPCGEVPLSAWGGFCVIADVVPFHCKGFEEVEECLRVVTRALMRVNLMPSVYDKEVKRTNRIGVGLTGIHEYAWYHFGHGFRDLINEEKSRDFWLTIRDMNKVVREESKKYAKVLGVEVPHTCTTVKPSGSVSKLFALTEGWHLPSMREFLRWVQFRDGDPLIEQYWKAGYPVQKLRTYEGTTIVGFPTAPAICELGMGDKLVTAAEATPAEQFQWLKLGEKYWIEGTEAEPYGGQISYTLKYDPKEVSPEEFRAMMLEHMPQVRCCSVMPQTDTTSYEYQPEQPVTPERFKELVAMIVRRSEDVGREHIDCDSGACPIDFGEKA